MKGYRKNLSYYSSLLFFTANARIQRRWTRGLCVANVRWNDLLGNLLVIYDARAMKTF